MSDSESEPGSLETPSRSSSPPASFLAPDDLDISSNPLKGLRHQPYRVGSFPLFRADSFEAFFSGRPTSAISEAPSPSPTPVTSRNVDSSSESMLRTVLSQCQDLLERVGNVKATIQNFQLVLSFIRASPSCFSHSLITDVLKFLKPLTRALYDQPTVAVALLEQANLLAERFSLVEYQIKFSLQMPLILLPTMEVHGEEALKQLRRAVQECAAAHLLVTKFRAKISLKASSANFQEMLAPSSQVETGAKSLSRNASPSTLVDLSSPRHTPRSLNASYSGGLGVGSGHGTPFLNGSAALSDTPQENMDSLSSKIDRLGVKLNALLSTLEKMFLVYTATHISFHPHILHSIDADTIYHHYTGLEKLCTHLLERGDYARARLLFPSKLQNHLLLHNIIYGLPLLQINADINQLECSVNGFPKIEGQEGVENDPSSLRASSGFRSISSSSSRLPIDERSDRTLLLDILNELEQEQEAHDASPNGASPENHHEDNYGAVSKLNSIRTSSEIEREFGVQGSHFMEYRNLFAATRKQVPSVLLVSDDQGNLDVNLVNRTQLKLTRGVREILVTIIEDVLAIAGPPPCHFCIIGLGSHGRMEVAPFSDFEFALVLENEVPDEGDAFARSYFGKFIELMDFMVNCIGEPTGFRLDTQGTPKEFRFRGTPSQIIERTFKNLDAQGIPMAFSLLQPTCIYVGGPPKHLQEKQTFSPSTVLPSTPSIPSAYLSPPKEGIRDRNSNRNLMSQNDNDKSSANHPTSNPTANATTATSPTAIPTRRLQQHAKQTSTPNFSPTSPNPSHSPRGLQFGVSISSSSIPSDKTQLSGEEEDLESSTSSSSTAPSYAPARDPSPVTRPLRRPSSTVAFDHPGYALYAQYQDQVISRLQHDIWKGQPLHASLARYCLQDHIKMLAPGKKWHKGEEKLPLSTNTGTTGPSLGSGIGMLSSASNGGSGGGVLGGGGFQGEKHRAVHLKDHYLTPLICFTHDIALYYLSHIPTVFPSDVSATAHLMDSLAVSNARTPVPVFSQLFAASFREAWAALNAIRLRAETEYGEQIDAETPVYLDPLNAPPGAVVLTPIERYWLKYVDWVVQKPLFKVLPTFLEAMPGASSTTHQTGMGGSSGGGIGAGIGAGSGVGGGGGQSSFTPSIPPSSSYPSSNPSPLSSSTMPTSPTGGNATLTGGTLRGATGHGRLSSSSTSSSTGASAGTSTASGGASGAGNSSSNLRRPPRRNSVGQGTHPPGLSGSSSPVISTTTGISSNDILASGEVAVKDSSFGTAMNLLPSTGLLSSPTPSSGSSSSRILLPPLPIIGASSAPISTRMSAKGHASKNEDEENESKERERESKERERESKERERESRESKSSQNSNPPSTSIHSHHSSPSSPSASAMIESCEDSIAVLGKKASLGSVSSSVASGEGMKSSTTFGTPSQSSLALSGINTASSSSHGHVHAPLSASLAANAATLGLGNTNINSGLSAHGTISLPDQEVEMMDPAIYCVEQLLESVRNGVKVQEWEEVVISLAWTLTLRHSAPKVHLSYYRAFPPEWRHIYYQTLESLELVHAGLLEHVFNEIRSYADPAGTRLHSKPMDTLWREQVLSEVADKLDSALLTTLEDKQKSLSKSKSPKSSNGTSTPQYASPSQAKKKSPTNASSNVSTNPSIVRTPLTTLSHQWLPSKTGNPNVAVTRADTPESITGDEGRNQDGKNQDSSLSSLSSQSAHPSYPSVSPSQNVSSSSPSPSMPLTPLDLSLTFSPVDTLRAMPEYHSSMNGKKLDKIQPKKMENLVVETDAMIFLFPRNLLGAISEVAAHTLYRRIVFKGAAHVSLTKVSIKKGVKDLLEASIAPAKALSNTSSHANESLPHQTSIAIASTRSQGMTSSPSSPLVSSSSSPSSSSFSSSTAPSSPSLDKKKLSTAAFVVQKVNGITLRQVFEEKEVEEILEKLVSGFDAKNDRSDSLGSGMRATSPLPSSSNAYPGLTSFGFLPNVNASSQALSSVDHHSFTDSFLASLLMIGTERFPEDVSLVPQLHIDKENQKFGVFRVVSSRHSSSWRECATMAHDSSDYARSDPSNSHGFGANKPTLSSKSSSLLGIDSKTFSPFSGDSPLSKSGFDFTTSYRHSFLNVLSGAGSKHLNLVKNILFCLDNMNEPPHPDALYQFLDLDPLSVITSWIKELKQIQQRWAVRFGNADCKRLFPSSSSTNGDLINIPSNTIARMTLLFAKIQSTLRINPRRTCLEVLRIVHPILGHVYGQSHNHGAFGLTTPLERFAFISQPVLASSLYRLLSSSSEIVQFDPLKSKLLFTSLSDLRPQLQSHVKETALLSDAPKVITDQHTSNRWEIFSWPGALISKLFDALDWRDLSSPLQLTLLNMLETNGIGRTSEIAIRHCDQLDNTLLESLVRSLGGQLSSLHMPGCQKMENRFIGGSDVVKLLADHCPNLRSLDLSGTNIKYFAVQQLTRTAEIKFERLEWLCLDGCKALEKVKLKTPALWHVDARHCPELIKFEAEARDNHWATADLYGSKVVLHSLLMSIGVSLSKPLSSLSANSRRLADIIEPLEALLDEKRKKFELANKTLPTDYCLLLAAVITYHPAISDIYLKYCELDEESVRVLAQACFTNRKAFTYNIGPVLGSSGTKAPSSLTKEKKNGASNPPDPPSQDSPDSLPKLKLSILHTRVNAAIQQDILGRALGTSVYISFNE